MYIRSAYTDARITPIEAISAIASFELNDAEQDQELTGEVRRAGHRQRRQRDDQEQRGQHRRAEGDPAVVADVLRAVGPLGEQRDDEEQRRHHEPVVDRLQQRALGALGRLSMAKIPSVMNPSCATDE